MWVPDTDALDLLLGRWVGGHDGHRVGPRCSARPLFYACEEAHGITGPVADAALLPTVNTGRYNPGGSGLLIDWVLLNRAFEGAVVKGSVQVDVPPEDEPYDSDHRTKRVTLEL